MQLVWPILVDQQDGRIILTVSGAGLFGNFGQVNYGAAKMALIGMMKSLGIEGRKHNILVNALAPTAATSMTKDVLSLEMAKRFAPASVLPALLLLAHEAAPNRTTICAGAGTFEQAEVILSKGIYLGNAPTFEGLAARVGEIGTREDATVPEDVFELVNTELAKSS